MLKGLVPSNDLEVAPEQLRLTEQGQSKLGLTSLLALAVALWSANSAMKSMFEAMNVAYDEEEERRRARDRIKGWRVYVNDGCSAIQRQTLPNESHKRSL